MKRGRNLSLASEEKKPAGVYATEVRVQGGRKAQYSVPEFPYELSIES
jgi:hypothetical protein